MINKRFQLQKLLGEGRSKVFLCSDIFHSSQKFAIKILSPEAGKEEHESFLREFSHLKSFSHPNISKVFEAGVILELDENDETMGVKQGGKFILLEYIEGVSLLELPLQSEPKLLHDVILQMSSFLMHLHLAKYGYFDLKLENILCVQTGEGYLLKIIDFGFLQLADVPNKKLRRGTPHYIAPEILIKGEADTRADLYSFGVLLYRLVYGKFPVEGENEMEIFRAHSEDEIDFPVSQYPQDLLEAIEKLLKKNPDERFQTALELCLRLQLPTEYLELYLISSVHYLEREAEVGIIENYLKKKEGNDLLLMQGSEKSGKTTLARITENKHSAAVLLERFSKQSPETILRIILYKVIFNPVVFVSLHEKKNELLSALNDKQQLDSETVISLFSELVKLHSFILLLDDYHQLDGAVKEVLQRVFPILQVHGCKILLFEETGEGNGSAIQSNKTEVQISPFSTREVSEFLTENLSNKFPHKKVLPLIKKFADSLPGNMLTFIRELIAEKIIVLNEKGIFVRDEKVKGFSGISQQTIFQNRVTPLTQRQKESLQVLASIEVDLTLDEAAHIIKKFTGENESIFSKLQKENLLRLPNRNAFIQFASPGLKLFVYDLVEDKSAHHKKLSVILNALSQFPQKEISRHYELAGMYDEAYLCLKPELERAYGLSAYLYLSKLLSHFVDLLLSRENAVTVRKQFLNVLQKTGDNELALSIIADLETTFGMKNNPALLVQKGSILIAKGEIEAGKKILSEQVEQVQSSNERTELLIEIANADIVTNRYAEADDILRELLQSDGLSHEQRGKIFNMLGLMALFKDNDTEKAFLSFQQALDEFIEANLNHRIARVQVNLGNICSMKGDYLQAEAYWKNSLSINNAIGDLEQEALLLMNYGIYQFDTAKYEQAVESYQNAKQIFQTIGKRNGYGLSLMNEAETHLMIGEYSSALSKSREAVTVFQTTNNIEEEAGAYYALAKTFAVIGSEKDSEDYIKKYQSIVDEQELSGKHLLQMQFMQTLHYFYFKGASLQINRNELLNLYEELVKTDNKYDTLMTAVMYVELCLKKKESLLAHLFLEKESLTNFCATNGVYRAVQFYLLGEVARQFKFDEKSYVDYYLEAYALIKDESVTEFTRMILVALSKVYLERNLFYKAKEFFNLTEGVITFFAGTLTDPTLKETYLTKNERRDALQFINDSLSRII